MIFNLRDFHHAVNNIPNDAFSPELDKSGALCCKGNISLCVCTYHFHLSTCE